MSKSQKKTRLDLVHIRNTTESVYIAIVLAFVLRAFLVQAFVIPTGSMANSLYGEHFELECPCCHYNYPYGATQPIPRNKSVIPSNARCPNCGYIYADAMQKTKSVSVRGGDKVLVMKYLYDFSPPQRWDVIVFRNPQNNRENYIKRLIGLPGETLEIIQGDIFVSADGGKTYSVARKPRAAQEAMWYTVYDNDYIPNHEMMQASGRTAPKWKLKTQAAGKQWDHKTTTASGMEISRRVFHFNGSDAGSVLEFDPGTDGFAPVCSYNSNIAPPDRHEPDAHSDICTDWMLSCVLTPDGVGESQLAMTFLAYEDRFRAEFNTDGTVRLLHQPRAANPNDPDTWEKWGEKKLKPFAGSSRIVALSKIDYRVVLRVDGREIISSTDDQYDHGYAQASRLMKIRRNPALDPMRYDWYTHPAIEISAKGAPLTLEHIKLLRDVYYTTPRVSITNSEGHYRTAWKNNPQYRYIREKFEADKKSGKPWARDEGYLAWGTFGNPIRLRKHPAVSRSDLDEYFCLGDNSPQSLDGRGWLAAAPTLRLYDKDGNPQYQLGTVPRYNIIGRALLVFWPSGFRLPVVNWAIVPNVGRMRLIR